MRKINLLVSLAVGAALAAPAAFADDGQTTVGGLIYTDFTSISTTQDAPTVPTGAKAPALKGDIDPNGLGLDVKRAYLIVNHSFNDIWSANITTDFNFASYKDTSTVSSTATPPVAPTVSVATSTTTPETQLFIKKAYVQGKFDDLAILRVGSSDMPWIPFAESVYGYRFLENTLIDRTIGGVNTSFGSSADWGLILSGKNDLVSYSLAEVNGNGYKNPTRSKSMDTEGRIAFTPLDGDLIIAAGFYTGKRGQDTESEEASISKAGGSLNTVSRTDYLVAWKASGLTVGLEGFTADKWLDVTNGLPGAKTNNSSGTSLYGSFDIPSTDFSVFARYDDVKPKKDTDSQMEDKYYNAGVAWKADSGVTWALAYKSDKVTDNLGYNLTNDDLKTNEFGVWAQVKF